MSDEPADGERPSEDEARRAEALAWLAGKLAALAAENAGRRTEDGR